MRACLSSTIQADDCTIARGGLTGTDYIKYVPHSTIYADGQNRLQCMALTYALHAGTIRH